MYGSFYTKSEYKALENKLKRAETKVVKQAEMIKSLKAELKRVKAEADNLSTIVFDTNAPLPPEQEAILDEINENLDAALDTLQ